MDSDSLFKDGMPETSRNPKIVCEENKSKYIALNFDKKLNCKIRIDNALIKDKKIKKCDFGLWVEEGNRMILIELKGSDLNTAVLQLENTYSIFSKKYAKQAFSYSFRVVPTRVATPNLQESLKQFKKKGYDIKIKSITMTEKI